MEQQAEEQARKEAQLVRTEAYYSFEEQWRVADSEVQYFERLMTYNNMKIDFYWALEMSIDYNAPDGEEQYDYIREKLDKVFELQNSLQQQADVIYDHISNINFERFIQEVAWAVEDERAF